jgi:Tol biopolymer transport system component
MRERERRAPWACAILLLGLALLAVGCAEPATAPEQAGGRLVAFMSDPTGNFEIYLLDPSNESIESLTANPGFDGYPHFHPDGQSLLFTSERSGRSQDIYRMSREGTGLLRLTEAEGRDITPVYSPDASRIVFVSERDEDLEIYIMNGDGSGQTRLTDSPGLDFAPVFSPDGEAIYFISERAGYRQILRMALDGSNLEFVLGEGELLARPGFDPATGRLFYAQSTRLPGAGLVSWDLWQAQADGSGATRLSESGISESDPVYSADGGVIAFSARLNTPDEDLFVWNPATGELDRITNSAGRDLWPTFDPTSGR